MMTVLRNKGLILSLISFALSSCGADNAQLTDDQLLASFYENKSSLMNMAGLMKKAGLTRVTHNSVYPKSKSLNDSAIFVQKEMARVGINVAIQNHIQDKYYEYVYWSSGLAGRGSAKLLIFTAKPINDIDYLNAELKRGNTVCKKIELSWYMCDSGN